MREPKHENMREITTRSQLREGNRPGEGRLWESGEPMNKNRIDRPTRPDELAPHGEVIRFRRGGKCGGCAVKQRVLTWGDPLPGNRQRESAEAIVMGNEPGAGRGPLKHETGSLDAVKGQTDEESHDPAQDMRTDDASRLGGHKCRRGEKHGGSQGRSATYASFRRPVVGLNFTRGQRP